mmetsp:Transcript_4984/g.8648  ORF Transcript_4984/g.8648 Transcript_4984/m.8648 type:complete len:304 (-) Transcript_4984:624-1535(-)
MAANTEWGVSHILSQKGSSSSSPPTPLRMHACTRNFCFDCNLMTALRMRAFCAPLKCHTRVRLPHDCRPVGFMQLYILAGTNRTSAEATSYFCSFAISLSRSVSCNWSVWLSLSESSSSGGASGRSRVVLTTRAGFCIISRQRLGSMLTGARDWLRALGLYAMGTRSVMPPTLVRMLTRVYARERFSMSCMASCSLSPYMLPWLKYKSQKVRMNASKNCSPMARDAPWNTRMPMFTGIVLAAAEPPFDCRYVKVTSTGSLVSNRSCKGFNTKMSVASRKMMCEELLLATASATKPLSACALIQ